MSESFLGNASRAKVFCREHASRRHNTDKCVERRLSGILQSPQYSYAWEPVSIPTMHLSSDAARAPEEDTSSGIPRRFWRMS